MRIFFHALILLFTLLTVPAALYAGSATTDTRSLSAEPKEIYGPAGAVIALRIGNGGAGPTGILRALAEDYLAFSGANYAIAWYQDISKNTLLQLKKGTIDIALIYEKSQGKEAQEEGWATHYTPVFNDHFLILGPKSNPAQLQADSPEQAFAKIAQAGKQHSRPMFLSRDDNSGTNVKEHSIWQKAGLSPWKEENNWYVKLHVFPKDALMATDKQSLYTISDWGTWLSNASSFTNSAIYVRGGEMLLNPCFALLGKNPGKEVLAFLEYLKSPRAQQLIATFGKERYGHPLFTPAAQADF